MPLRDSQVRLFVLFAVITLVAVLLLGLVLALSYRSEANRRGLAQGRSEALLMAQTAMEPILDGRPLSLGLNPPETAAMQRLVRTAVHSGDVLRLRLRDLDGVVIYSNDGSALHQPASPDNVGEIREAASGSVAARVTFLNADSSEAGYPRSTGGGNLSRTRGRIASSSRGNT